jgi:hypothetical protein
MIGYSVVWPIKDCKPQEGMTRDYLNGIAETEFRSARLNTWFDVPESYFKTQFQKASTSQQPKDVV